MKQEKRLRVGFDARWHNDSGVGTYVAELLRAMAASEAVELVVYEMPGNQVCGLDGCRVEKVAVNAGRYSIVGQIELARRAREDRIDVFHSPFYVAPLRARCPVVVTIHDLIPFLFSFSWWPKSALVKKGYLMAARKAAHIIAVSHNTAADVRRILGVGEERVHVVYNAAGGAFHPQKQAAELEVLEQRYGVRRPYVVAASTRNWRTKNLVEALSALHCAQNLGARFQTVIYGPNQGIKAAGAGSGWSSLDLRLTGQIETAELGMLFRHASAFIMPSLYEGFGLPIVEAMACGCPVVTSRCGSLAEVAGGGAQTLSPIDVEGMAQAVARLLTDPEQSEKWRTAALRRSAEFSWQRAAEETISVYHRACREGTATK